MKRKTIPVILLLLLSFLLKADEAADLIAAADALYAQRAEADKANQALTSYQAALKKNPFGYEALWKISKTLYFIGMHAKNDEERKKIFGDGIQWSKQAIAANANGVEGHFWLGVHYGKYGEARGVLKSLFLIDDIKEEMNKTIALDERYDGAGAYRVLGRLYYKVPGLFGGSNRKSRENLEKARRICPSNSLTLLYLAETYWEVDEPQLAIKTLEELLAMTPDERWITETREDQITAQQLLNTYRQKM